MSESVSTSRFLVHGVNICVLEQFVYNRGLNRLDFKDMDLDLDHFLNLEQLIPAGFTVAKGSIF